MTLIERIEAATGPDNKLDIAIDIHLFEPDDEFHGIRANAAGTKLIYGRTDGTSLTCWARDWTLTPESRAKAIQALLAWEVEANHEG